MAPSNKFGDARGSRRGGPRGGGERGRGRGEHRGRGRGGGRGAPGGVRGSGQPSRQDDTTDNNTERPGIIHFASEGTDDLITAPKNSASYERFAGLILRNDIESFATQDEQKPIRSFVNSCLLNLSNQNGLDTSGIFGSLSSLAGCTCLERILTKPMSTDAGDAGKKLSFQYVVLPLIGVLTRESVCQSVMTSSSSRLYSTVYAHRKAFLENGVLDCMDRLLKKGSLLDGTSHGARMAADASLCQVPSLQHALLAISRLIYQLVKRIEDAKFELESAINRLSEQRKACLPKAGVDSAENCFLGDILAKEVRRLEAIVSDARATIIEPELEPVVEPQESRSSKSRGPNMVHLAREYDPPGELSRNGPRHDNDHWDISLIDIVPTIEELTSTRGPFIPSNCIPEAPHFLLHGWKRQLDIHFRLYREDLMNPLRTGLMAFLDVLSETKKGKEDDVLKQRVFQGKYDSANVDVYGNLRFIAVDCEVQGKDAATVKFAQPFQVRKKPHGKRREFWVRSRRRLMHGALVFMVHRSGDNEAGSSSTQGGQKVHVILGVIADRNVDDLSRNEDYASLRISLMDPALYVTMIDATNPRERNQKPKQWFLVEPSGAFYESYRPVLEVLQSRLPSTMPFGKCLAPTKEESGAISSNEVKIDPPMYARSPGFRFNLSTLLKGQELELDATSPASAEMALKALQKCESLDDTQSRALVDTLCREVALISGPPGTGKTRIGVELMRVLLDNVESIGEGPILCICYTNHALDQFLEHLLDEGIQKIIRIGSRSKSGRLESYNLEGHVKDYDKPRHLRKEIYDSVEEWKTHSEEVGKQQKALRIDGLPWDQVERYLIAHHPDIRAQFLHLPLLSDLSAEDDYTTIRRGAQRKRSVFHRWSDGDDIEEMKRYNEDILEAKDTTWLDHSVNPFGLLEDENGDDGEPEEQDLEQFMYEIPSTDRPLEELLDGDVWEMSMVERKRLVDSWRPQIRNSIMNKLTRALERAKEASERKNSIYKEIRRDILCQTSVIGMTTSGAAKHQALINAVAPKVIICEEAGEVVESHILATLSSSTQHLIMIGDHLQLRPQIQTYNLSSDSTIGRNYNLDISLFERLVTAKTNPLPSSQLTIQRRMRPEISNLIRNTLYPHLEDGGNVNYPDVSGMSSNLHFMDHSHPVDSKDQYGPQSFSNTFEVKMVEALVHYLMMNGYHQPGDIAVLTPYLGQLSKLKACLGSSFVLVMDERDEEQLDMRDAEKDNLTNTGEGAAAPPAVVNVPLNTRLALQTIDNYQGEEAKVVIISLVRSDVREGGMAASFSSIGFLKSPNRTNVLLSRAKHGMYLIGNAHLMEKRSHGIWPQVVTELRESGRVSEGFPIACKNHPEVVNVVDTPEMLRKVSPNGGCERPCGYNMTCGHVCPLMCHPGDLEHMITKCSQPCMRLQPVCDHVCPKKCGELCGDCMLIVDPIVLQCGHVLERPRCHQAKDSSRVRCNVKVTKKPPSCEHEYVTECDKANATIVCKNRCESLLGCGHICQHSCSGCQKLSSESGTSNIEIVRTTHGACLTKCNIVQPCGHVCKSNCHIGTPCPPCTQPCLRKCAHGQCRNPCNTPCNICLRPCTWECPHNGRCKMPCGLPCDRPPCDKRCGKTLSCGHQCPSVCGEECPPQKFCVECKDTGTMNLNVSAHPDVVLLRDLDVNNNPVLVLTCGHAVAMSVLDSESKKATNLHELYSVRCPWCQRWTAGLMRYEHRVKHLRLDTKMKNEQTALSKEMKEARERCEKVYGSLQEIGARFLESLSKVKAPPRKDPPMAKIRRLGKPDKKSTPFPQSDVKFISKVYGVPVAHEKAWRALVEPLTSCIQLLTSVYHQASETSTKTIFDTTVKSLCRFGTEASSTTEHKEVSDALRTTVLDILVTRGYPWNGLVGSISTDSMQERTRVLFVILSLAFSALDNAGSSSGWYWLIEDVINCVYVHVMMFRGIASQGNYKRRVIEARLMLLDLICKRTLWIGLGLTPTSYDGLVAKKQALKQLQKQEEKEQVEVRIGCIELGMTQHHSLALQLSAKMARMINVANGETLAKPEDWGTEDTSMLWSKKRESSGSKYRLQCKNGHSFVVDQFEESLSQWRCFECQAGPCDSPPSIP